MSDQAIDRSSFLRSLSNTDIRPYLFLAGLQALVSYLGTLLITTGLLG